MLYTHKDLKSEYVMMSEQLDQILCIFMMPKFMPWPAGTAKELLLVFPSLDVHCLPTPELTVAGEPAPCESDVFFPVGRIFHITATTYFFC